MTTIHLARFGLEYDTQHKNTKKRYWVGMSSGARDGIHNHFFAVHKKQKFPLKSNIVRPKCAMELFG